MDLSVSREQQNSYLVVVFLGMHPAWNPFLQGACEKAQETCTSVW